MPTAPGNFSYQLTTTGPCLNAAISGMITVNTLPVASFTGLAGPYCADADEALILLSAYGYPVKRLEEGVAEWWQAGYSLEKAALEG
jgi:hypothetical protein